MPLVDLDDPEELRARWSALAAVAHATGYDRRWYADEHGWYHQDETGSDLRMVRLDGGRAVLFGFHTQHTQTAEADLLAGAPPWIGQPEVKRRMAAGDLGFVYGSFNGTWARASYPGDPWQPLDDGFLPIGEWVTSDEEAAREMIEWAAEWADYLGGLDELLPVGVQLIRTAATTGITPESLLDLFDRLGIGPQSPQHPDLRAALAAAAAFAGNAVSEPAPEGASPRTSAASLRTAAPTAPPAGPPPATPSPGTPASPPAGVPTSAGYSVPPAHPDAYSTALVDEPDDEEPVAVPPGISPFTGQPIGDDANLIIGGNAPYTPEPPFTPVASEPPFTPEPPLNPEPPFRPDSPFAPEPPFTPEPDPDPPYQPEDAAPHPDDYGVVAKKPRLFRRRKHEEPHPQQPGAQPTPPAGTPFPPATGTPYGGPDAPPHTPAPGDPYRSPVPYTSPTDGPRTPAPTDQYARPIGDQYPPPAGDQYPPQAGDQYARSTGDQYPRPTGDQRPTGDHPSHPDASAPSMARLPSSEPRVGGPVDDGEDFYASLFADAPAAATYVPDVTRNTPAEPNTWSADDATNEIAAITDDTGEAPLTPDVSASDDTGVIPPIPATEDELPTPQNPFAPHQSTAPDPSTAPSPTDHGAPPAPQNPFAPHPSTAADLSTAPSPTDDGAPQNPFATHPQPSAGARATDAWPDTATEPKPDAEPAPDAEWAQNSRPTMGTGVPEAPSTIATGQLTDADLTAPAGTGVTESTSPEHEHERPDTSVDGGLATRAGSGGADLGLSEEGLEPFDAGRGAGVGLGGAGGAFEARPELFGANPGNAPEAGTDHEVMSEPVADREVVSEAAADREVVSEAVTDREDASEAMREPEPEQVREPDQPHGPEQVRGPEQRRGPEQALESEYVAEGPIEPAKPEWIGGAWINGEWVEDVAAYLAAQHAAGPAKAPAVEELPTEDFSQLPPADDFPTEEHVLGLPQHDQAADDPPTEERVLGLTQQEQAAEDPPTEELVLGLAGLEEDPANFVPEVAPGEERFPDVARLEDDRELSTEDQARGVNPFARSGGESPTEDQLRAVNPFERPAGEPSVRGGDSFERSGEDALADASAEERLRRDGEFERAGAEVPAGESVDGGGSQGAGEGWDVEEPSTEERVRGVNPFEQAAERVFGAAARGADEAAVGEQLAGVPAEQLGGVQAQAERAADGLTGEDYPGGELGGEPGGEAQGEVEGDAPTAEIAAVVEEEYYAGERSPFVPEARDIPPNGFSSLEPLGDFDYRLGENFHDEILGDADWTADQLGEPQQSSQTPQQPQALHEPQHPQELQNPQDLDEHQAAHEQQDPHAVYEQQDPRALHEQQDPRALRGAHEQDPEALRGGNEQEPQAAHELEELREAQDVDELGAAEVTAQFEAVREDEPEPGEYDSQQGGQYDEHQGARYDEERSPERPAERAELVAGQAVEQGAGERAQGLPEGAAGAGAGAGAAVAVAAEAGVASASAGAAEVGAGAGAAGAGAGAAEVGAGAGAAGAGAVEGGAGAVGAGAAEGGGQVEAPGGERPEKLVVPDEGRAVAIPGVGVVGGEGPRVETPPGSIEEAMRAEVERPRPRPKESAAFHALREWCRARTKVVPSGFTIQVQVLDPAAPSYRFDLEPPEVDDPEYGAERLTELLGDLWLAESQGEQGGWLFARLDAAGRTLRIDRWYDSVPDWWDNPVESRLDVDGLVRRLNGRGADWQPSYLEKLYTSAR
ncbi:hypothetical protein [Kribbella sp. NPDC051718]|uniref:hypothetical protein n=1 Tax=Kribbella sp. NPDC051718 TaxID=3155168 RepID=UPI0034342686